MISRIPGAVFLLLFLPLLVSCSSGFKDIVYFSEWYTGDAGHVAKLLPILVFLLSLSVCTVMKFASSPVLLLAVIYINLSCLAYFGFELFFGITTHGQYFLYSLKVFVWFFSCLLYTSPSPRDGLLSRMPSSA